MCGETSRREMFSSAPKVTQENRSGQRCDSIPFQCRSWGVKRDGRSSERRQAGYLGLKWRPFFYRKIRRLTRIFAGNFTFYRKPIYETPTVHRTLQQAIYQFRCDHLDIDKATKEFSFPLLSSHLTSSNSLSGYQQRGVDTIIHAEPISKA